VSLLRPPQKGPAALHLREVLAAHGPALRRMASSWTRTPSERDDLMQDIALALLKALPGFRGECPERAFVWRVAHNVSLAAARLRKRQPQEGEAALLHEAATTASPEEVREKKQQLLLLQAGLRLLREDERTVLVLALEGLSHDDIAIVVGGGANANAIGVRLHRAREALTRACASLDTPTSASAVRRSA